MVSTHLEKDRLYLGTVLAFLLFYHCIKDVLGRDPSVCDTLVVAKHPDQDIRDRTLGLGAGMRGKAEIKLA